MKDSLQVDPIRAVDTCAHELDSATQRAPMVDAAAPEGTFKASPPPPPRKFRG